LTQATGCEELDGAVNETITCNEHERPEKSETASFSSSLMDDNSMLGVNHSSVAEWQSVYDMALRKTSNSPHETEQLKKNLIALEEEMSMVLEQLQSLSDELEKYRTKSTSQNSELLEANRKLSEVTKSKEYAERTVADYEFIVEDLKKRHTKQKEHLLDKVLSLEDELDKLRSQCASQSQLALTSLSIKNDLSVVNERLLLEEKARATAEERCETLAKELQLSLSAATSYANELAIANENATSIAAKLSLLENRVNEKDNELITLRERNEKECMEIQMKLKEAEAALVKSKEEVGDLLKQLAASEDSLAVVREAHTNSEMELMSIKDELERFEIALRQSEECRLEASTQCSAIEKELNSVRVKLDSLEQIETTVERLKNECARLEEELCAEKLGYDILNREVEQLRREKNACNEALEEISFALREAETRASIAEKDLLNHTKCHTEELRSRIVELEAQIAVYPAERESLENKLSEQMKKETVALAKNEKTVEALEKAEAEIADLRKAKNDLQNEVRLMKVSHEDYTARTEKLATTVVELEVQVDLLQCERDELKYKMVVADEKYMKATATAEEMIDSLKSDIESGLSERELLCNRLAAAENSKGILENDLAEMRNCMMELESTIEMLKSEARGKSEELVATNEKLKAEIAAHEQTANAFTSLEKEYLRLKKEKEAFYIELEEQKKCYAFELEEMTKEISRMEQEICESKASRFEADVRLTELHQRFGELRPSDFDEELKKLRKQLEIKSREIDRLAGLCDEFDEIEENYRRELFAAIKERDQLKAQLNALKTPEHPNLEVAFMEGISVPSSDMCGDGIKVASSSQKLFPDAHNVSAGPTTEVCLLDMKDQPIDVKGE
uniref:Girdin n=1 Tax=Angiostrongylus cantonensis TaxID=6313 RepID=A0A158PCR5_ANGCA